MLKPVSSKKKEKPIVKPVSFKKTEKILLKFIKGKDFSYYVKGLIKKDMEEQEEKELNKKLLKNKDM